MALCISDSCTNSVTSILKDNGQGYCDYHIKNYVTDAASNNIIGKYEISEEEIINLIQHKEINYINDLSESFQKGIDEIDKEIALLNERKNFLQNCFSTAKKNFLRNVSEAKQSPKHIESYLRLNY